MCGVFMFRCVNKTLVKLYFYKSNFKLSPTIYS